MSEVLDRYLTQSYRRDVMGESVKVEAPMRNDKLIGEIKAELARIDGLRLGAHLALRDSATYQHKIAMERLLKELEQQPPEGADNAANGEGQ